MYVILALGICHHYFNFRKRRKKENINLAHVNVPFVYQRDRFMVTIAKNIPVSESTILPVFNGVLFSRLFPLTGTNS